MSCSRIGQVIAVVAHCWFIPSRSHRMEIWSKHADMAWESRGERGDYAEAEQKLLHGWR